MDTIQPKYSNYEFYERRNLDEKNNFFFYENLKYYTHATRPCQNVINFYLVHLIFLHLRNRTTYGEFVDIITRMHDENTRSLLFVNSTKTKDEEKLWKKNSTSSKIFTKAIMHHSLVAKHSIQNGELIAELKFPLSLSFYQIPVDNKINFSESFGKFSEYKQTDNSVSFKMKIFASNNESTDESLNVHEINSNSWKQKLSLKEFRQIRESTNGLDLDLLSHMIEKNKNDRKNKDDLVYTRNTEVVLSVDFNFKEAIVIPIQYDLTEINSFIKQESPNDQNDQRPRLKLLRFTENFIYCMRHSNQKQDKMCRKYTN